MDKEQVSAAPADREAWMLKAALMINRLILAACGKASQPAETPPEDRITDADIDALEAALLAHLRARPAAQALSDEQIAVRGRFDVAVALLRECLGPLEVSAAIIESDDGEPMEALIRRAKTFVSAASAPKEPAEPVPAQPTEAVQRLAAEQFPLPPAKVQAYADTNGLPTADVLPVEVPSKPDTRKPWEKSSWTCARATVNNTGLHCPPPGQRCPDCPSGVALPAPDLAKKPTVTHLMRLAVAMRHAPSDGYDDAYKCMQNALYAALGVDSSRTTEPKGGA
jgi:hypothetical protein